MEASQQHSSIINVTIGKSKKDSAKNCNDRTGSNGYKPKEGKFMLEIWKKFFTMRTIRHWNRLLQGQVVAAPNLGSVPGQVG